MHYHIRPERQRLLHQRSGERIINRRNHTQPFRSRTNCGHIPHLKHGVRGALNPDERLRGGIVNSAGGDTGTSRRILKGSNNRGGVLKVITHHLSDTAALQILTHGHRRHIGMLRHQNNGTNRHQVDHRSNRRHTRRKQQARLGSALKAGNDFFHSLPRIIREPRIHAVIHRINRVSATVGGGKNNGRVHRRVMLMRGTPAAHNKSIGRETFRSHTLKSGTGSRPAHPGPATRPQGFTRL